VQLILCSTCGGLAPTQHTSWTCAACGTSCMASEECMCILSQCRWGRVPSPIEASWPLYMQYLRLLCVPRMHRWLTGSVKPMDRGGESTSRLASDSRPTRSLGASLIRNPCSFPKLCKRGQVPLVPACRRVQRVLHTVCKLLQVRWNMLPSWQDGGRCILRCWQTCYC
jgi:hypothetical protein